jgi:enoyl-CoA hydratase/carnithine racemase
MAVAVKSETKTLLVEQRGAILEVQLNRPEARNALNSQLHTEFDAILDKAEDDESIRVVTVTGVGPVFSAGHDLKEVASGYATEGRPSGIARHRAPALPRSWYFKKPIVAGVHGYVGPAANHLIEPFDFVIAVKDTRFSFEQTRMGGGGAGGTILAFQVPMRALKKLYMLGGWFDADTALQWDYVQRVMPTVDEMKEETRRWAEQLALIPARQLATAKEGIHRIYELKGLLEIMGVQNKISGHGSSQDMSWFQTVQDKGLREALKIRDAQFDQKVAKI